jgi:O-antigen/teichoic acid export membrane protein
VEKSLLKNGFYNIAGGAIRVGLAILTIPILIRLIGVEEYGLWTLASAVVGMVTLAEAGLSVATTVFVSQDLGKEDINGLSQTLTATLGAMLILATLAAITLRFGAEPIISFFPKLPQAQKLIVIKALQIGSLVVWARLLQQVLIGVEQAYQRYDLMNVLNTIQSVLMNLGMLVVVCLRGQTVSMMQWQAIASIVTLLTHVWIVRSLLKGICLRPAWNTKKGLEVGRYSLITWLTSLGSSFFSRADRLVVGSMLGTQSLGVYAAITDIAAQINTFSALPVQPLLPNLSNLTAQKNIDFSKLKQQIKYSIEINALVALGLGATLITLSPLILNLLFPGETVNQYILPFCISITIYSIYSINAVGFYILLSKNAVNTCAIVVLISGIFSLALIALGSHLFGLMGAIVGNTGYITTLLLNILGMKLLSIEKFSWIRWLYFPGVWFSLIILVNLYVIIQYKIRVAMFIIQSTIIFSWFFMNNKHLFSKLITQVNLK